MLKITALLLTLILALTGTSFASQDSTLSQSGNDSEILQNQQVTKIRVGFFAFDGYHEVDKNGNRSGLGYDFLQLTKRYANLRYEYVGYDKSWSQLLEMLENGDIDMLAAAYKDASKLDKVAYSRPIGVSTMNITTRLSDHRFVAADLSTYNAMKIGLLRDRSGNQKLADFARENGFSYVPMYYEDTASLQAALRNKQIDAICTTSLRKTRDELLLNSFAVENYYVIVKKDNTQLLSTINYAIAQMDNNEGDWRSRLYYKNYRQYTAGELYFTPEEQNFIKAYQQGKKKILLASDADWAPFSSYRNAAYEGIIPAYWDHIMKLAGLEYDYYTERTDFHDYTVLQNKKIDLYLGYSLNTAEAEKKGLITSPVYMNIGVAYLYRRGTKEFRNIALSETTPLLNAGIKLTKGQMTTLVGNTDQAVQMVKDGRADAAYVYALDAERIANKDPTNSFEVHIVPGVELYLQAVASEEKSHILMSIISKCIHATDPKFVYSLVPKQLTYGAGDVSFRDWINLHPFIAAFIVLLMSCTAGGAWIFSLRAQNKLKLEAVRRRLESAMLARETALVGQLKDSLSKNEAHLAEITSLHRTLERNHAELLEAAARNRSQYNVIISMSKLYFASYLLDLENNTVRELSTLDNVRKAIGEDKSATESLEIMCRQLILPEYRDAMLEFTDLSTLQARLKDRNFITHDYVGVTTGWSQGYFIAGERNPDGTLKTVFYTVRTIHDEKAREEKQQKLLEKALEAAESANNAKTAFLFNMSHDIRTPMNAIIGFRDLLEKYQDDPLKRADYLTKIDEASTVLLSIINNVLEMARIEKGTIEIEESAWSAEQFNDTLYSVFHELMQQKGITFTREISVEHHYVLCDPTKLREVFLNILSNAYKYTGAGGSVHMRLEEIESDREGCALYKTTISDTGIGMSEEFLPHIFEEFSREQNSTQAKIEGTGLGMSIVRRLVDLMHGTIEVSSKKGQGTTFVVTIPHKITQKTALAEHAAVEIDQGLFKGKRILLAEDNDLNAEISTEILSEAGFVIERAEDGERCVEMLMKAPAGYYDLILMDIQMPRLNGYDATRKIRSLEDRLKSGIPILAMTANAFEEDKRAAYRSGMNAHLSKPINVHEVMKTLALILS